MSSSRKTRQSINVNLNDSDDSAFTCTSLNKKRPAKTASDACSKKQKSKEGKVLSQSTLTAKGSINKPGRKPPMNRTAPASASFSANISSACKNPLKEVNELFEASQKNDALPGEGETEKEKVASPPKKKPALSKFFQPQAAIGDDFKCPLCSKTFVTNLNHISHVKQCAKKKKVSTAQLVKMMDKIRSFDKAGEPEDNGQSKSSDEKSQSPAEGPGPYELALGTALSASLDPKPSTSANFDKTVVDSQKTTLEKFGFTSTSNVNALGIVRKGKGMASRKTALKTRTAEERLQILTEKAAVILLDEDKQTEDAVARTPLSPVNRSRLSNVSSQLPYQTEVPKLWELGQSESPREWYLENLRPHISPDKRQPQRRFSGYSEKTVDDTSDNETSGERACTSLSEDWGRLCASTEWSDDFLEASDGRLPIHTLVIRVRCPAVDLDTLKEGCKTFTVKSLQQALRFIYTGVSDNGEMIDEHELAVLFQRPDMERIKKSSGTTSLSRSDSDVVRSSVSPKQHFSPLVPRRSRRMVAEEEEVMAPNIDPDLADTVPVNNNCLSQETEEAVVDLTQSRGSPVGWIIQGDEGLTEDQRERVEEMAKIQSFIEQQSSDLQESEAEDERDRMEMEKLFYLRQSIEPEKDLFDDEDDVQVISNVIPKKSGERVEVVISSDSDHNNFEDSTDEDVRSPVPGEAPIAEEEIYNPPYYETPDYGIDYDQIFPNSQLKSQSLVGVSPRTPRRVLASSPMVNATPTTHQEPQTPRRVLSSSPVENVTPALRQESRIGSTSPVINEATPAASRNEDSGFTPGESEVIPATSCAGFGTPFRTITSEGRKKEGSRKVMTHRRSYQNYSVRRNARRSLLATKQKSRKEVSLLSESIALALNETWKPDEEVTKAVGGKGDVTPCSSRPFIEVTPRLGPSAAFVDSVTPRPDFSAMKTGTIKKHLHKYGLKRGLEKVKAKKILGHLYDELHPVVNKKTGKIVKYLPNEKETSRNPKRPRRARRKTPAKKPKLSP